MAFVAGGLIAIVGFWGMMTRSMRRIAKSGLVIALTTDSMDSEQSAKRRQRALDIQTRQAQVALKLWPLAVILVIVAVVLLVID